MSEKLSFCSMMTLLGVLSVVVTLFIPTVTVFFWLFSTLFVYISTEEYGFKYGVLTYLAITLICFLLVPNKLTVGVYAIGVGYYPIVKHYIEHLNIKNSFKYITKTVFCIIALIAVLSLFKAFLYISVNYLIFIILALILFFIYDKALSYGIMFYVLKLRKFR